MPLFQIQDCNRPGWVVAESINEAINKWLSASAAEEGCSTEDISDPDGVVMVCDNHDLILTEGWVA